MKKKKRTCNINKYLLHVNEEMKWSTEKYQFMSEKAARYTDTLLKDCFLFLLVLGVFIKQKESNLVWF